MSAVIMRLSTCRGWCGRNLLSPPSALPYSSALTHSLTDSFIHCTRLYSHTHSLVPPTIHPFICSFAHLPACLSTLSSIEV